MKWLARYNYAKAVREEMKKDVEDKTSMLYDTIRGYITPRLEELIKMHLRQELVGYKTVSEGFKTVYKKCVQLRCSIFVRINHIRAHASKDCLNNI